VAKNKDEAKVSFVHFKICLGDNCFFQIQAYEGDDPQLVNACNLDEDLPADGKLYEVKGRGNRSKFNDLLKQLLIKLGDAYPKDESITLKLEDDELIADPVDRASSKP
jgi:hypothetical protein